MVADGCDEGGVLQVRCKAGSSENIEVKYLLYKVAVNGYCLASQGLF